MRNLKKYTNRELAAIEADGTHPLHEAACGEIDIRNRDVTGIYETRKEEEDRVLELSMFQDEVDDKNPWRGDFMYEDMEDGYVDPGSDFY